MGGKMKQRLSWFLALALFAAGTAVAVEPTVGVRYTDVERSKTQDLITIRCRLELVNHSDQPLTRVVVTLESDDGVQVEAPRYDSDLLAAGQTWSPDAPLTYSFAYREREPPQLTWRVDYVDSSRVPRVERARP
jgi:hypothetical protein